MRAIMFIGMIVGILIYLFMLLVGRKPYGFFETKTIRITDSDLVEIANRCEELMKGADDADTTNQEEVV